MPIRRRLQRILPENSIELTKLLLDEWTKPKNSGQPIIVIEGGKSNPIHVTVIWDKWGELNQIERSEIIMDAIESLTGEHQLPPGSPVTVAMGLTKEEAKRMGIKLN